MKLFKLLTILIILHFAANHRLLSSINKLLFNYRNNSTATSSNPLNTNVLPNEPNSTNAVGKIGPSTYSISTPPYTVRSCDQVILMQASTITNEDDYSQRKPAFFTMNLYMLNMLESSDSSKLINSIYLNNINRVPSILKGSKDCAAFNDDKNKKQITLCDHAANEILEAFNAFTRCRAGDNLKSQNIHNLKKIILKKKCLRKKPNKTNKFGKWTPKYITKVPGSL